jgi:hypothetical protein
LSSFNALPTLEIFFHYTIIPFIAFIAFLSLTSPFLYFSISIIFFSFRDFLVAYWGNIRSNTPSGSDARVRWPHFRLPIARLNRAVGV